MKSRYENEMELTFLSKSNNEAFARITVAAFAAQLDPSLEELADIKTAVSEAVTNCIIHGYEDMEGMVKVRATLLQNSIEIEISDNGKGIENVEIARKPLYTTKGNLERSGMGFTIMESFMDEVQIHSVVGIGTKVVMKKEIKKDLEDKDIENNFIMKQTNDSMENNFAMKETKNSEENNFTTKEAEDSRKDNFEMNVVEDSIENKGIEEIKNALMNF